MRIRRKCLVSNCLLLLAFPPAACQQEPEVIEVTRIVTEVVEVSEEPQVIEVEVTRVVVEEIQPAPGSEEATEVGALASVYRIGIREEPPTSSIS